MEAIDDENGIETNQTGHVTQHATFGPRRKCISHSLHVSMLICLLSRCTRDRLPTEQLVLCIRLR